MSKGSKKYIRIQLVISHNAMYVKGVKRHSKYAVKAHNIFTHNFLNIQLIFNLEKVLES